MSAVLGVSCNHCGAPLEVGADTRFIRCGFCGSRLEVHRAAGACYTSVLERVDRRTSAIADDLQVIAAQNRLAQVDREWEEQRALLGAQGGAAQARRRQAALGVLFVLALVWAVGGALGGQAGVGLIACAFAAALALLYVHGQRRLAAVAAAEARHARQRAEILAELEELTRAE